MHYVEPSHWSAVRDELGDVPFARAGCGEVVLAAELTTARVHVTCADCLEALGPEGVQWRTTRQAAERLGVDRSLLDGGRRRWRRWRRMWWCGWGWGVSGRRGGEGEAYVVAGARRVIGAAMASASRAWVDGHQPGGLCLATLRRAGTRSTRRSVAWGAPEPRP